MLSACRFFVVALDLGERGKRRHGLQVAPSVAEFTEEHGAAQPVPAERVEVAADQGERGPQAERGGGAPLFARGLEEGERPCVEIRAGGRLTRAEQAVRAQPEGAGPAYGVGDGVGRRCGRRLRVVAGEESERGVQQGEFGRGGVGGGGEDGRQAAARLGEAAAQHQIDDDEGRRQWQTLLKTIEKKLVLADRFPGMIAEDLSDYLYARSTGHFASLMSLINRGCLRAIRSGHERLDEDLMNQVKNDVAAEESRKELKAAIEAGLLTSRPAPAPRRPRKSA